MRNAIFLGLFVIGFLSSCKKDPKPPPIPTGFWGEASATYNGKAWSGLPTAIVNINHGHGWNITIDSFDQYGQLLQSLVIDKVPFTPGTYPIVNTLTEVDDSLIGSSFSYWTFDQIDGLYRVLESDSSSFVTMIKFDSATKELWGTFDITFIAAHKPPYGDPPDTLRLRNGSFHTKVRDK